jgi:hypothetical protein
MCSCQVIGLIDELPETFDTRFVSFSQRFKLSNSICPSMPGKTSDPDDIDCHPFLQRAAQDGAAARAIASYRPPPPASDSALNRHQPGPVDLYPLSWKLAMDRASPKIAPAADPMQSPRPTTASN